MARPRKDANLMARGAEKPKARRNSGEFICRAAVASALCRNEDFKAWLFSVLDDLSGFARDEGLLTDFGQGIRAAAARIQHRLLYAEEAVDLLAEMHKYSLKADRESLVEADKRGNKSE